MTLDDLLREGKLQRHRSSADEIANLLAAAERDMADAAVKGLSLDRRFTIAYSAALALASAVVAATGYRSSGVGHHSTVLQALPLVMGADLQARADYLDTCRRKRNLLSYERVGIATEADVEELQNVTWQLRAQVHEWLHHNHPELAGRE